MTGGRGPNDESFSNLYLSNQETLYKATNNPVIVWWAIHWCLNENNEHHIPAWCLEYLAEVAKKINSLGQEINVVGETAKGSGRARTPVAKEVATTLGFSSKGRSSFQNSLSDMRKIRAASRFNELQKSINSYTKALRIIQEWLGDTDPGNTKKTIQAGRRLLRGKTST